MPDQGKGEIIYVVQKGDSLSKIAEKYEPRGRSWQNTTTLRIRA